MDQVEQKQAPKNKPTAAAMLRLGPAVWLATGSWVGLAPVAPGTFGSLVGLPVAWAIACIPYLWLQGAALVALFVVGVPVCTAAARRMGGLKDPGAIVLDEILGMAITLFMIPLDPPRFSVFAVGFLLFRLFDVTKPPPIGRLERLPNGLGIMADDCLAGVFANLCLRAILWSGWL